MGITFARTAGMLVELRETYYSIGGEALWYRKTTNESCTVNPFSYRTPLILRRRVEMASVYGGEIVLENEKSMAG